MFVFPESYGACLLPLLSSCFLSFIPTDHKGIVRIYSHKKRYEIKEKELALSSARIWHLDCSIHVLYKTWIFIDRLSRDNRSNSLTRARTNSWEHYLWLHQISLINQLWHHWKWQATFENITARYFWMSRNILHVNLTPVKKLLPLINYKLDFVQEKS